MKRQLITFASIGVALVAFLHLSKDHIMANYTEISGVGHAHAAGIEKQIFGQVHYDQASPLPSQANLLVQLIDQSTAGSQKVISEARIPASNSGKTEFKLPIELADLSRDHKYSLKARISIGDSLIYVSETPTIIDPKQSGYIMRLASIGQQESAPNQIKSLTGSEWIAREINNIQPPQGLNINFTISNPMQMPALGINNNSAVANHYIVNGSGGCNRFFSMALINEKKNTLTFDPLGMTFISCPETVTGQENRFVNMISKVRSYEIDKDNTLNLKDEYNHIIARFVTNNSI
ncbi:META domain-containing protein [Bartonella sp. HY329]|uniref:META domain-containing protein n=1 Tax=unclassified Bartonella TaxID=2645622 RepID=UPI0021C765A9|nr:MULTISPECIES: META domain-containing protein [unclassified Bartonella]UXM96269.1 META domain-containing protein [Bartonella sp. HY329]UXN10593.1 META domain-containing protein [Bartonella sp. HY328]